MIPIQRLALLIVVCLPSIGWADSAEQILERTGVEGGLVVHLGCGDGKLTAALRASDGFLVHGLDADPKNVAAARKHVQSLGLYGSVAVDRLRGNRLPYADNLVNLIVSDDLGNVPMSEVRRALCPGGVACVKDGDAWKTTVKPWPGGFGQWTHFLHGPDNNAVGCDSVVDVPRHLRWLGGPKFARAHEQLASMSACVTTGGRLFYIIDDTPRADVRFPSKWSLVARDAFNGVVLWKRPIPAWVDQFRRFRAGPPETAFRLAARDDRVYVTLGFDAPVSILDAVTGQTLLDVEGTEHAREILHLDDKLVVLADTAPQTTAEEDSAIRKGLQPSPGARAIVAADASSGKTLWRKEIELFVHPTLAARSDRLFYQTNQHLFCLDLGTGDELWRAPMELSFKGHEAGWESPTLVVGDAAVYCADFKQIAAFAVKDGEVLWTGDAASGYNSPPDVFLIDDLVWIKRKGMVGLDAATGEVKKELPTVTGYMHHRCYRNKATERFFLRGDQGVQFVDVESGDVSLHHWIRGTCQYGIMPANGLLYVTPDSCACNMKTKLAGFWALAPERSTGDAEPTLDVDRLEKGPAFGKDTVHPSSSAVDPSSDWPVHRHDFARSGTTSARLPAKLRPTWRAEIGGRLSGVTAAGGKVFVASVDTHTVHALDQRSAATLWSFTAGGRVDSPPTIYRGMALFGSADGWVYALRASDGELVWRFCAAPEDRRTFVNGQIESIWPVHGSVLVEEDKLLVAAGRSSYLDGGIRLCSLDPDTGKMLAETVVYSPDPETGKQPADENIRDVRGLISDILLADGGSVYMRHVKLDFGSGSDTEKGVHLFSPIGLLDDTWWHRGYWVFNDEFIAHWSGWWKIGNAAPAGRILSYDESSVFGYGRDKYVGGNTGQWRGGEKYQLFACDRPSPDGLPEPVMVTNAKGRRRAAPLPPRENRWAEAVPFYVRAMLVAGDTMFIAGPPELTEAKAAEGEESLVLARPEDALAAWQGERGGLLWAVSTADGKRLSQYKLGVPPVFDGMAATEGRLYLAMQDGSVVCYAE
ncbi:MAG: PQQ-binding-like beta-propeller repeat protein [Planctomycetes bacterium]|nr:PQQ-binding-like beta-propeller repeat protein [Planctomycetota bacterium]